jgi:hypothetical protein
MPAWPISLPQFETNVELTQQQGFVRSPTEIGPSKQRKRFTAVSKYYSGTLFLTRDQRNTLESFYEDDLGYGSLSFDFTDPIDNSTTVAARFMSPPSYSALLGGPSGVELWRASVQIEVLP